MTTPEVDKELRENVALLEAWLEARYLSDDGYPEFVRPDAEDLMKLVSALQSKREGR